MNTTFKGEFYFVSTMYICKESFWHCCILYISGLELNFTATWGDHHYLGLTGLEIVGKDGEALPVNMGMLTACPSDVRTLPGHERDDRTLDK